MDSLVVMRKQPNHVCETPASWIMAGFSGQRGWPAVFESPFVWPIADEPDSPIPPGLVAICACPMCADPASIPHLGRYSSFLIISTSPIGVIVDSKSRHSA